MFTDHFDQAFCINLDSRKDRWKASQKQFKKIGLKVERIPAINGFEEPPASIRPGEVGCLKSHLKVFQIAKERGLKSFLMLEDDVEFSDTFHERFNIIESQIKPFEMLYFGSNPHSGERHEVSPNINRITYTFSAHCVIFKESCFDDIIRELTGPLLSPVDVVYGRQQVVHTAYSIKPALAWQRKDFSDINQEIVDYQFLRG
jgi:GR25 family glycosyltransferase involved in LPS biosynthesis